MRTIGLVSLLAMSASIGVHAHELGSSAKNTIIDKKEASNYTASNDREVYLQVATFKQANNAVKYKRHVSTLTKYPVSIKVRGHFHVVLVGPINDTADLRALTKTLLNKSSLVVKHNNTMATESVEHRENHKSDTGLSQGTDSSKMGSVLAQSEFIPFISGEGLFAWPTVKGFTITTPPPELNVGTSKINNRGWGGRIAAGLMTPINERFAYSGEVAWGYYGHTQMPVVFDKPLSKTDINTGLGNTTGSLERWGFDVLAGLLYTQPKYDLYVKAGALFQNLRVNLSDIVVNREQGSISTNSNIPNVLPEIKLGAAYHITDHLGANVSWMYAFGGPFDVILPYNDVNGVGKIGASSMELKNPSMNVVMFGLEYRFG